MNAAQVWTNGNILTMEAAHRRVSALVVRNGEIAFTGDAASALAFADPETIVRNLAGRAVVADRNYHFWLVAMSCRKPGLPRNPAFFVADPTAFVGIFGNAGLD